MRFSLAIGLILGIAVSAQAQPATSTAPARHEVVVPAGFNRITVSGRNVLIDPKDSDWIQQTLTALAPTTMPSTMPADMFAKFSAQRENIKKRMIADLAISDPQIVDKFFDEKLQPRLKQFVDYHPPIFYLITSHQRLKEIIKAGWTDPRFYYNRAADDVEISAAFNLSVDKPGDDILLPVVYDPADPLEKKQSVLADQIHSAERGISDAIANRAMIVCQVAMVDLVVTQMVDASKVKPDQTWVEIGLAGVLSAQYSAAITGIDSQAMLEVMSSDNRRNPIRSGTIDLLHPTPVSDMRPQAVSAYTDAYRRKATRVMMDWLKRAGDGATAKLIVSLRQNAPADGDALVKQIQQVSGVDLTADVATQK